MKERLRALLPDGWERIPVMTFHALGYRLLREHAERAGLPPEFRVAGEAECAGLAQDALAMTERQARRWQEGRSALRRQGAETELAADGQITRYRHALRERGLLDFDDLIGLSVELLARHPDLAAHCRQRWRWVSVDEFQDIDERQYCLVKLLVPPDGNVCAIGDPDQAIYGFRGTDVRFFRQFMQDFAGARVVRLSRNYR